MRVADCATLSALHLTLFDIYSTNVQSIKKKTASVKRVCLGAMAIYEGLNFCGRSDLQKSITNDGIWVFLRTNRLALFKSWEPQAKTAEKQLKVEMVKPNLS